MLRLCTLLRLANMESDKKSPASTKSRHLLRADMKRSNESTDKADAAFNVFLCPFDVPDIDQLYILSSGQPATEDIAREVLNNDELGAIAMRETIRDRIVEERVDYLLTAETAQMQDSRRNEYRSEDKNIGHYNH